MAVPPFLYALRIGPWEALVRVHVDVRVVRVVIRARLDRIRRPALQIQQSQISASDQTDGLARKARRGLIRHLPDQPRHVRSIANEPRTLNLPATVPGVGGHLSQQLMPRPHAHGLQGELKSTRW